jgi:hypothetical protein
MRCFGAGHRWMPVSALTALRGKRQDGRGLSLGHRASAGSPYAAGSMTSSTRLSTASDPERRCATVRTLWAHVQARDWTAMRALLADGCTTNWPATRERFLDADAIVRVQAIYPEGWSIHIGEVLAAIDGRVVSTVTVTHGAQTFLARSIFGFDGDSRIAAIDEVWATVEPAPAWRTAASIGAYERG